MADQFSEWGRLLVLAQQHKTKAALRTAIAEAKIVIHETDPLSGYYRCAAVKDGPLLPVAIWRQDGKLIVLRNNEPVPLDRVWNFCVWTPIPYDWYEGAVYRGEPWPDDFPASITDPAAEAAKNEAANAALDAVAGQPVEDEATKAKREIEAAKAVAEKLYATINSEDEAGAAQALRSKLNTLSNEADKRRKAQLLPFETEVKKINATWMPLVKAAKGAADDLRDGPIKTWLNRPQPQPEPTAPQMVPTARTDGDEVPVTHNQPTDPISLLSAMAAAVPPAQPSATVLRGATGRAAPIYTNHVAVVTDYDALYQHAKAFPEVKATLDRIAQRLVDAGNKTIPGVEIKEERSAA